MPVTPERVARAFEESRGQEIDTQGDSFFVAFSSPKDAVHAAVAAQRSLAEETWPEGTAVKVRMGIHTGDASLAADRAVEGVIRFIEQGMDGS